MDFSRTVLVFGTFDLFHAGHDYFLTEAGKRGGRLVVVVARDVNVERIKGQVPEDDEDARLFNVLEHDAVNEAMLGSEDWGRHLDILDEVKPDVVCLGYDQHADLPDGPWEVVRLGAYKPEIYKTSKMK